MRAMPQPVIAAVNGPAYGGGLCLTPRRRHPPRRHVGDLPQRRHQQRAHRHRAGHQLAAAAPGGRRQRLGRHPLRPRARRRRGAADRPRLARPARRDATRGGARAGGAALRLQSARARDDQEGPVVEPRDRQPRGGDGPGEPQPAARPPHHAEPPGGDHAPASRSGRRATRTDFSRNGRGRSGCRSPARRGSPACRCSAPRPGRVRRSGPAPAPSPSGRSPGCRRCAGRPSSGSGR